MNDEELLAVGQNQMYNVHYTKGMTMADSLTGVVQILLVQSVQHGRLFYTPCVHLRVYSILTFFLL